MNDVRKFLALLALAAAGFASCSDSCPCGIPELPTAADAADLVPDTPVPVPFDWCVPDRPPDDACYAQKRDPASKSVALARAIADRWIDVHPAAKMGWGWEESVLMVGMIELHRVTGETAYRDYYETWIDHHIEAGYNVFNSDSCPPALAALALLQETGDPKYRKVVDDVIAYLFDKAPRDADGGINHLGELDQMGITLWLDSLFMFGTVLARWGEFAGDERSLDEYRKQFLLFMKHLQGESGLCMHAWNWVLPQDEGVYWARGNAWVTAATFEYLRARRCRGEKDDAVLEPLRRQVAAVLGAQDPGTGLWWTVLNRPGDTYLETSASALFAWGFSRAWRYGFADPSVLPAISKAMSGLSTRIRLDDQGRPVVTGTSGPTTAGGFDNYAAVKQEDDLPFGVGAVVMALVETSGL
jgi:unsaturated rhamnogalacturonyl hydrolase